jgi:RNA polymerase sigma factor for flagellar operon FliA
MYNVNGRQGKHSLLEQHVPLVKKLAHQLKAKLPPSVEVDDLVQAGMMGSMPLIGMKRRMVRSSRHMLSSVFVVP